MNDRLTKRLWLLIPMLLAATLGLVGLRRGSGGAAPAPVGIALVRAAHGAQNPSAGSHTEVLKLAGDARNFAFDVYREASRGMSGDVFMSPYSIHSLLALVHAGAGGETQQEIANAARFSLEPARLHAAFGATSAYFHERTEQGHHDDVLELRSVNAAFAQQGLQVRAPFLSTLSTYYDTGMFLADFAHAAERERLAINDWVADQTAGHIDELMPSGSISSDSQLVLVNAIYFNASWRTPFKPQLTRADIFHTAQGDVNVQMMQQDVSRLAKGDGYRASELAYGVPALRMLFILPDAGRFEEIESRLDRSFLEQALRIMPTSLTVTLRLPKFTTRYALDLRSTLSALGMQRAFDASQADFSGIVSSGKRLYISAMHHQAFVAVDERGTEAAAATGASFGIEGAPQLEDFVLNRPFIFLIYDQPTGQVLFIGRLVDPR